jgi:SAM-dependent methyltransferase
MSKKPDGVYERRMETRGINEMGLAFMSSGVLMAAMEFDLFTQLSRQPATISDLAGRLGITERGAEKFLTCCLSLGLVRRDGDVFSNTEETEKYMVKGKPSYMADYLLHMAKRSYSQWGQIADILKGKQKSGGEGQYRELAFDPKEARALTEAGYTGSIAAGRLLGKLYDFSPYSLLLDLGGGSGAYSIAAVQKYPGLKAIVFDFPVITEVAREFISREGLGDRVATHDGDFLKDPFPEGADVILNSGNLHAYGADSARNLYKKAFDLLPPGGGMIVIDYMLDERRSGPPVPAFIDLGQYFTSDEGRTHTAGEVSGYLADAGFRVEGSRDFIPGSLGMVWATKP